MSLSLPPPAGLEVVSLAGNPIARESWYRPRVFHLLSSAGGLKHLDAQVMINNYHIWT